MSSEQIADGKVVTFHYTLKDDDGTVIEGSQGKTPLGYLHGAGNIVPGLETALTGKTTGDAVEVVVEPADGYGERDERGVMQFPKTQFPNDPPPQEGMQFGVQGPDGQTFPAWVTSVADEEVTVDFNHPLAGVRLHFEVEVVEMRDATDEEKQHGHPKSEEPCGCGCAAEETEEKEEGPE